MNQFEYLIPFVGFIYALSATDILVSAHRIIIERKTIIISLVPIIWAVVAFLMIINGWWGFLSINSNIALENAGQLFILSLLPLVLFMIASLSLPHKVTKELSLWTYFDQHKVPFYLAHALYLILIPIVFSTFSDNLNLMRILVHVGLASMFICVIWLKHWGWHLALGLIYSGTLLYGIFNQSI